MPRISREPPSIGGLSKCRDAVKRGIDLCRLTRSPAELASVAAFVAREMAARLVGIGDGGQAVLRLQDCRFAVGFGSGETLPFCEILLDRVYERVPSFRPTQGDTVVDVGANIGVFAVVQGRRGASVYAFEPNPRCFARLSQNIASNGLEGHVQAFNVALGDRDCLGALDARDGTIAGTVTASVAKDASVTVPISTLDAQLGPLNLASIDVLKVDVEGAEAAVLSGASQTLQRTRRVLLEFHSHELRRAVDYRLRQAGFRLVADEQRPQGLAFYVARPC